MAWCMLICRYGKTEYNAESAVNLLQDGMSPYDLPAQTLGDGPWPKAEKAIMPLIACPEHM